MGTTKKGRNRKVAFVSGASRGIGHYTALKLAEHGYDLVLTARTVEEGEAQSYAGKAPVSLPGSLSTTAKAAQALGAEVLMLKADILDADAITAAAESALAHFGQIDLLFNNACYQGPGNLDRLLDISADNIKNIYQGNVLTPMALVQHFLPGMIDRDSGCIINMVSGSALHNPPAPADKGGWGFAYPSSKAALIRMVPSLRVEHADTGLRFWNIEPGFVVTEVMRANGIDDAIAERFKPTEPTDIADVVLWLATSKDADSLSDKTVISAPSVYKKYMEVVA
jgi:NAD(P)-dependent dehydrogenase (short-subunit alcohol dehydrogenase family)